jgi:uncharacterized protein YeaO (DUF488 family)
VLIDRLWPRGVSRQRAKLDGWERSWPRARSSGSGSGTTRSASQSFRRRYIEELRNERSRLTAPRRQARAGMLTLVYSAHDPEHNDAVVLAEVLRRGLPSAEAGSARR